MTRRKVAGHETNSKLPLDRQTIAQQIENINVGYGANELFPLLQEAAKIVSQKFSKDDRLLEARANQFYYMHGQEPLRSREEEGKRMMMTHLNRLALFLQNYPQIYIQHLRGHLS
jgi:hypothetical protein